MRLIAIGGKLVLVIVLGKALDSENVADYVLIASTVLFVTFFLGFEFHTYSTRELIKTKNYDFILSNKIKLFFIVYVILLFLFWFYKFFGGGEVSYLVLFIIIIEHFLQEAERLLVALQKQLCATIVLMFRSGFWCYAIGFVYLIGDDISLGKVISFWLTGDVLGLILVFSLLKVSGFKISVSYDLSWLIRGIKVSVPFLFSALFMRLFFILDRYFISWFDSKENVAIYGFFINFANLLLIVSGPLISVFLYPKLISFYSNADFVSFRKTVGKFYIQMCFFSLLCILFVCLLTSPVLEIIGKNYLHSGVDVLYLQFAALFFYNLSVVPHYILYSFNFDKVIFYISLLSVSIFLFCIGILHNFLGMLHTVSFAMIISFLFMFLSKYYWSKKLCSY
ncbi:oligosaccharide flippase family protein [Shewanella algae]|uniref:oligosaccharide flippase family protein n=1 Tax=Shewanella algae TaxID=38313 RepID=UPI0034D4DBF1